MAVDAKVSQIDELTAYAGKMQGFMESMSGNCTALNNLMVQKLDGLRKKLKKAEQMESEAVSEYKALLDAMAKTANNDVEGRRALLAKKNYLENRKNKAKRMRETVSLQVVNAQAATMAIIGNDTVSEGFKNHCVEQIKNDWNTYLQEMNTRMNLYMRAEKTIDEEIAKYEREYKKR